MIRKTAQVLWFSDIKKDAFPYIGDKVAHLSQLQKVNIPVPNGFVVTSTAYFDFINSNSIKRKILTELSGLDIENSQKIEKASKNIKTAILSAQLPDNLINQIKHYYHQLCGDSDRLVAVSVSLTDSNMSDSSLDQPKTYLDVKGWEDVAENIQKCWASLFDAKAIFHREIKKYAHLKAFTAVSVQLMVHSDFSGIMSTINPLTNNADELSVEAVYGFIQPILLGEITPDQYIFNKRSEKITYRYVSKQLTQLTPVGDIPVSKNYQSVQKIPNKLIVEIAKIGLEIEKYYGKACDIHWGVEQGRIYIMKALPIKNVTVPKQMHSVFSVDTNKNKKTILHGLAVSTGVVSGSVVVVRTPKDLTKVKEGDILVTEMTNADYIPAMQKAYAVITGQGARSSHAAVVSRELGIPAIVGASHATKILTNGEIVTVDGLSGKVYEGDSTKIEQKAMISSLIDTSKLKTATKLYINVGDPGLGISLASKNIDGVGLLKSDLVISTINKHPKSFVKDNKQKEFIEKLAAEVEKVVVSFDPRPVVYRFTDFTSNDFISLKGSKEFEHEEKNPMLGHRGVSRYLKEQEVFAMEVEAIKQVRNKKGYKNLWVSLPVVRTIEELREVKKLMGTFGLRRSGLFKLWMIIDVPSNVILLDEFISEGIDGISVDLTDLTSFTLGVDKNNSKVTHLYNEMDPAVLKSLEKIITTCKKHKITCSVSCATSLLPVEFVDMLTMWGVSSLSVDSDIIDKTRLTIYSAEKKLLSTKGKK